jgi:hypothetical protein
MMSMEPGDLVRLHGTEYEMLAIGSVDDDEAQACSSRSYFCVWERNHRLFEEVIGEADLPLVRRERRGIPRRGMLDFPNC